MAYLNNIYGNAAFTGFFGGMLASRRTLKSQTAADYNTLRAAALAMAVDVDALIPFDAEVSTGAGITQLAITTNTIASDEQWKAGCLHDICFAAGAEGLYTVDAAIAGAQTATAAAIVAAWNSAIAGLVTP